MKIAKGKKKVKKGKKTVKSLPLHDMLRMAAALVTMDPNLDATPAKIVLSGSSERKVHLESTGFWALTDGAVLVAAGDNLKQQLPRFHAFLRGAD